MNVYKKKLLEIQQKKIEDREKRKRRDKNDNEGSPEPNAKTRKYESPGTLTGVCQSVRSTPSLNKQQFP